MIRLVLAATLIVLGWGSLTPADAMYCWDFAAQRYYQAEQCSAAGPVTHCWDAINRRYYPASRCDLPPQPTPALGIELKAAPPIALHPPRPAASHTPTTRPSIAASRRSGEDRHTPARVHSPRSPRLLHLADRLLRRLHPWPGASSLSSARPVWRSLCVFHDRGIWRAHRDLCTSCRGVLPTLVGRPTARGSRAWLPQGTGFLAQTSLRSLDTAGFSWLSLIYVPAFVFCHILVPITVLRALPSFVRGFHFLFVPHPAKRYLTPAPQATETPFPINTEGIVSVLEHVVNGRPPNFVYRNMARKATKLSEKVERREERLREENRLAKAALEYERTRAAHNDIKTLGKMHHG